jgi:hypothetical protein
VPPDNRNAKREFGPASPYRIAAAILPNFAAAIAELDHGVVGARGCRCGKRHGQKAGRKYHGFMLRSLNACLQNSEYLEGVPRKLKAREQQQRLDARKVTGSHSKKTNRPPNGGRFITST